jgi:hypothetical protein
MYDPTDSRGVPISTGVPPIVVYSLVITVIVVFIIGGMVALNSGFGHLWPASKVLTIPL